MWRDRDLQTRGYESFGYDLTRVQVFDDEAAHQLAAEHNAAALADDSGIFLSSSFADLGRGAQVAVLGHELAHVEQYRLHPVEPAPSQPAVTEPGEAAEREAARASRAALNGEAAPVSEAPSAPLAAFGWSDMTDIMGFTDRPKDENVGVGKDLIGQTAWDFVNDDTFGGLMDFAGLEGAPGIGALGGAEKLGVPLGLLSMVSGGSDFIQGLNAEKPGFESREKMATGALNVVSGGISAGGLFGLGEGLTASTAIGAGMGTGSAIAAGGQVIGAGLAGYGAGKLMDKGVGWLGGATSGDKRGLSDRMVDRAMGTNEWVDEFTGSDTAGDVVGGIHLAGETLLSPLIAGGEVIGDTATGAWNGIKGAGENFGGWMDRGIRGLYGF